MGKEGGGAPGERSMASRDGCGRVIGAPPSLPTVLLMETREGGSNGKRERLIPFSGWKLWWSTRRSVPAGRNQGRPGLVGGGLRLGVLHQGLSRT